MASKLHSQEGGGFEGMKRKARASRTKKKTKKTPRFNTAFKRLKAPILISSR